MTVELWVILAYFALISFCAIIFAVYDKIAAKCGARRIPERTLFSIAAFGGAVFMYLTMQIIRHKTRHKSFMIGIPLIIILQIAISVGVFIFYYR